MKCIEKQRELVKLYFHMQMHKNNNLIKFNISYVKLSSINIIMDFIIKPLKINNFYCILLV